MLWAPMDSNCQVVKELARNCLAISRVGLDLGSFVVYRCDWGAPVGLWAVDSILCLVHRVSFEIKVAKSLWGLDVDTF